MAIKIYRSSANGSVIVENITNNSKQSFQAVICGQDSTGSISLIGVSTTNTSLNGGQALFLADIQDESGTPYATYKILVDTVGFRKANGGGGGSVSSVSFTAPLTNLGTVTDPNGGFAPQPDGNYALNFATGVPTFIPIQTTTADNGLTKTLNNIQLGGAVTTPLVISTTLSEQFLQIVRNDIADYDTNQGINFADAGQLIISSKSISANQETQIVLLANTFAINSNNNGNLRTITFNAAEPEKGLKYKNFGETDSNNGIGADYSTLVNTSLVPKKYVDDATTLQAVTDKGNITTNDIKVNSISLFDPESSDYMNLSVLDNVLQYKNALNELQFSIENAAISCNVNTVTAGVLSFGNITAPRQIESPDKSGTIALLDDITSATTLQAVTNNGNTTTNDIKVNELYLFNPPNAEFDTKIRAFDTAFIFSSYEGDICTIENAIISSIISPTIAGSLIFQGITANRTYFMPNKSGTVALLDDILSTLLAGLNIIGGSISASDNILQAFGKLQNQINAVLGGAIYQGVWNANTNTPAITSSVGTQGFYYVVNVAGTTNLDGVIDWKVGDWAIFNGTTWDKVDNTDAVSSVNGFIGAVNLTKTDLGLSNVDNTSDINKPVSTAQAIADNLRLEKSLNLSDVAIPNTALNNILPLQTGNTNKVLATNGTDTLWVEPADNVISEYGNVRVFGQNFTTNTFVDSTNGIFNLPSAGTWKLRYDLSTDGSGVTPINSMFAITDSSNVVVSGSEKSRGGSVTSSLVITAEVIVTTTGAAIYKLRGRSGDTGGTATILNIASQQSTITWEKISGFIGVTGLVVTGATQTNNGISGLVPAPVATEQFKVLKGNGVWSVNADAGINFLNQIAAIGATSLFVVPSAGLYEIQIIGSVNSPIGNRNVTAQTIAHTEAGIVRTKSVGAGVNTNNLNNFTTVTQVFQCDAGTTINYSNTMTNPAGTGSYNVRILITKQN